MSLIGSYAILIAGVARSENLTLVTFNEKEFTIVGDLVIENWRRASLFSMHLRIKR